MNKSSKKKIKRRFEKKFYKQFFIVQANQMLTTVTKSRTMHLLYIQCCKIEQQVNIKTRRKFDSVYVVMRKTNIKLVLGNNLKHFGYTILPYYIQN